MKRIAKIFAITGATALLSSLLGLAALAGAISTADDSLPSGGVDSASHMNGMGSMAGAGMMAARGHMQGSMPMAGAHPDGDQPDGHGGGHGGGHGRMIPALWSAAANS